MKSMTQLFGAFGLAIGMAATAQAAPITGGTTEVTVTIASTLSALGASLSALGAATLSSGANPVVTFPITGGSTSSTGDLIEHNGSGLRITGTNPTTTVDTQNYLVDTGKRVGGGRYLDQWSLARQHRAIHAWLQRPLQYPADAYVQRGDRA